jgi:hypothetical protein
MKLLQIDSNARSGSVTRRLTSRFVEEWRTNHTNGEVIRRDLSTLDKNGPTGLIIFIGIAELAGGVGIVVPMATNVVPWLSLWLRLDSHASCCWRSAFTCAVMNRPSHPSFFSYWECS